jgi:hypothetical protein
LRVNGGPVASEGAGIDRLIQSRLIAEIDVTIYKPSLDRTIFPPVRFLAMRKSSVSL